MGTKYGTLCFQLLTSKVADSLSETWQRNCSPLCLMGKTTFLENQQMDTSWGLFINITILFYVKRCQNSCQNGFVKKLNIFVQILNEGIDLQYIISFINISLPNSYVGTVPFFDNFWVLTKIIFFTNASAGQKWIDGSRPHFVGFCVHAEWPSCANIIPS